jgi:hypothetical protein
LGVLTNGKLGEDPETGVIVEPLTPEESRSKRCSICEQIEREEKNKKRN